MQMDCIVCLYNNQQKKEQKMKFEMMCPHCKTNLEVQDEWCGMQIECPCCQQKCIVQQSTPYNAPPPPPADPVNNGNPAGQAAADTASPIASEIIKTLCGFLECRWMQSKKVAAIWYVLMIGMLVLGIGDIVSGYAVFGWEVIIFLILISIVFMQTVILFNLNENLQKIKTALEEKLR